jgi:hypothetical protein
MTFSSLGSADPLDGGSLPISAANLNKISSPGCAGHHKMVDFGLQAVWLP